jgi:hypothetical protein
MEIERRGNTPETGPSSASVPELDDQRIDLLAEGASLNWDPLSGISKEIFCKVYEGIFANFKEDSHNDICDMYEKQIRALSKGITDTNKRLDDAVWQMKRNDAHLRKVVKELQLQLQTLQPATPLKAPAMPSSLVNTPSHPSQFPDFCGEDKSVIPEADFKFVPEVAGVKVEADFSLVDDSDANNCRFHLNFKTRQFISPTALSIQPPTMLKADSELRLGSPEEKSSTAQPPRRKKGGRKKH